MAAAKPIRAMRFDRLKVFTGNANPTLAAKICGALGCTLGSASVKPFSDGEIHLQIEENVRGADVFAVQPTCTPVDRHLMELLLMIDALKRASAERITAVLPYYGYARQDRKDQPRMPISASLVANLIQTAGANRVLTLDLHAAQIQGFFDVPVDHLFAAPVMIEYFDSIGRRDVTVVSPDAGGVERARAFAKRLNAPLAIIDKRRTDANVAEVMHIIGDVEWTALFDCGRHHRYRRNAGESRRSAARPRRHRRHRLRHARRLVGFRGPAHREIRNRAGGGHQLHPVERSGQPLLPHQDFIGRAAAGARHSIHPRGWFGQHVIYLSGVKDEKRHHDHGPAPGIAR